MTRTTDARPAMAAMSVKISSQASCGMRLSANATGCGTSSVLYGARPVSTSDMRMYSTVQMTSEPSIAIGRSRCGFLASCAAVETASNPIYAKNTTAAPRTTPLQPNLPNVPELGAIKGCQFPALTKKKPNPMTRRTIATLMNTTMLLNRADSWMPIQ